jgi:TolB-like protein/class 3 adenylate cyclase/Tfp pilus assembly protein PilF
VTEPASRHHLGAVWFADIVGYTALSSIDEKRSISQAAILQAIAHRVVPAFDGRVLKHIGDEIMAEFSSTESAVRAAVLVHRAFRAQTAEGGFEPSELRVGIHVGDLAVGPDGDVYGHGVNGAARIREQAAPGEVLVSEDVWRQLRSRREFTFDERGRQELKGMGELQVFAIRIEGELPDSIAEAASPWNVRGFRAELVHRGIPKVIVIYALVMSLLLLSVFISVVPPGPGRVIFVVALVGFPLALLTAWFVDVPSKGLVRSRPVPGVNSSEGWRHPHLLMLVVLGSLLSVGGAMAGFPLLRFWEARNGPVEAFFRDVPIERSIAVLPFVETETDTSEQYFGSGVTDEILARLATVNDLKVISPTAVRLYRGTDKTAREIGEELGVGRILQGSVHRQDDRVRITVRLVDARTEEVLWADRYDRELADVFAIQTDIARRIVDTLEIELGPDATAQLEVVPMRDLEAYDLYLKGREYFFQLNPQDNARAVELFQRAIELDPTYAPAWAGLSEAYTYWITMRENAWGDSAGRAARRAIELDPDLAEAHAALGLVELYGPEPAAAGREFRRAIALNPNHALASLGLGVIENERGRFDEGLRWNERAARLEPTTALYAMQVGRGYWVLGDFRTAEWWYERALQVQPDQGLATAELARVALMRGDTARARMRLAELSQSARTNPAYYDEALLIAMDLGDLELARGFVDELPEELMEVRGIERSYLELEAGRRQRGNSILSAAIWRTSPLHRISGTHGTASPAPTPSAETPRPRRGRSRRRTVADGGCTTMPGSACCSVPCGRIRECRRSSIGSGTTSSACGGGWKARGPPPVRRRTFASLRGSDVELELDAFPLRAPALDPGQARRSHDRLAGDRHDPVSLLEDHGRPGIDA